jgi:hypothetical protein
MAIARPRNGPRSIRQYCFPESSDIIPTLIYKGL